MSRDPLNLDELEGIARARLPKPSYDYIRSGADDEQSLRRNRDAFARLQLRPRMLVDVSTLDLGIDLLGQHLTLPVLLAPTAFQVLADPEGEVATAAAAAAAGTAFVLSTLASRRLEEVAAVGPGTRWFQIYCARDRHIVETLVRRAEEHGFNALCLTVDVPVIGRREADIRNPFRLPAAALPGNLMDFVDVGTQPADAQSSALTDLFVRLFDPRLTWDDLAWLRSLSSLPLVLKGILTAEDARLALEHGVDGIVVSNHGGRQLDTVPAAIEALPAIAEAVDGRVPVLVDGGIRRGTDIVKALALGADAVLIGRPYVWGLASGGREGVELVLSMLRHELETALALIGCPCVRDLDRSYVQRAPW